MHEPQLPNEPRSPEHLSTKALRPQVWIGSLADYNAGRLHGDWVDAAVDDDALVAAAQAILASSREPAAEEWGIFDYEQFGGYQPGEYAPLETVATVARGVAEHGSAFATWARLVEEEDDPAARLAAFDDAYCGHYDSAQAWAEELIDSTGLDATLDEHVSDWLRGYLKIDYAAVVRDFQLASEVVIEPSQDGGIEVFDLRV